MLENNARPNTGKSKPGMVTQRICNLSTQEVPEYCHEGKRGLQSKTVRKKKT